MRIFKNILFVLLALFLVCFFVGCSNPSGGGSDTPVVDTPDDDNVSDGGNDSGESVTVNAVWDFATQPAGMPTDDSESNALQDLEIAPTSGEGATLKATGRMKWNSKYIQAQASSGVTVDKAVDCNKWLELTLEGDATVEIIYQGAGALDSKRYLAIVKDNVVLEKSAAEGIGNGTDIKMEKELTAGTYKIMFNGARIYSITTK